MIDRGDYWILLFSSSAIHGLTNTVPSVAPKEICYEQAVVTYLHEIPSRLR